MSTFLQWTVEKLMCNSHWSQEQPVLKLLRKLMVAASVAGWQALAAQFARCGTDLGSPLQGPGYGLKD